MAKVLGVFTNRNALRQVVGAWLALFFCVGCARGSGSGQESASELAGKPLVLLGESFHAAAPRTDDVMRRAARQAIQSAQTLRRGIPSVSARQVVVRSLVDVVGREGKIPSDQLHGLLYDLVEPRSQLCDKASCARLLGFEIKDINPLMDQALNDVRTSRAFASSSQAKVQKDLLASLGRPPVPASREKLMGWGIPNPGPKWLLAGTCAGGTLASYGLRSLGSFQHLAGQLNPFKNTIDYRNELPKKFQGQTGSCHLFATVELFRHSLRPEFQAVKKIDIARSFAEIWARSLGGSLDQAIENEVKVFKILNIGRTLTVRDYLKKGMSKADASEIYFKEASFQIRYYPQGGTGLDDFAYFREHGAILEDANLRPLAMQDLAALGEELALVRSMLLRLATDRGQENVHPEAIRTAVRPVMEKIFAVAAESLHAPHRVPLKKELQDVEMVARTFDAKTPQDSIRDFMETFQQHGPMYVGRASHATLVVGYNSWRRRFLLRDSDDPLERPYIEVSADAFFNNLRLYYYLDGKSSATHH